MVGENAENLHKATPKRGEILRNGELDEAV